MRVEIIIAILVGLCALWFNLSKLNETLILLNADAYNRGMQQQYFHNQATIEMQYTLLKQLKQECGK